ncbi:MAG: type II toxin-antitoxin system PemK/MazF family toxin [Oscillospiraceae bacterium]
MEYNNMRNSEGYWDPTAGTAIRSASSVPQVKRGDIFYIEIPFATGHEMEKARPGIIVSCDALNDTSPVINIVFCSASNSHEQVEHIPIRSTPIKSMALCEHIYTVDKSRIGKFLGHATEREMEMVGNGIKLGLNLVGDNLVEIHEDYLKSGTNQTESSCSCEKPGYMDLIRAEAERDIYKSLYDGLLNRMSIERSVVV